VNLTGGYDQISKKIATTEKWQKSRDEAYLKLQGISFPNRKNEDWRYLNVQAIADQNFVPSIVTGNQGGLQTESEIATSLSSDFYHLVLINGFLNKTLSNLTELSKEIEIYTIADIISTNHQEGEFILNNFAQLGSLEKLAYFDQLNQSFMGQGIVLKFKTNSKPQKPIHILHFTSLEGGLPLAVQTQCYVDIGAGSKISLLESFSGQRGTKYFTNDRTEILVRKNASLEYIRSQSDSNFAYHIGRTRVYLSEFAYLHSLSYQDGAKIGRHNLDIFHLEKHSSAQINGIYLSDQEQVIDNHTCIDHVVGECQSTQLYKGIVDQKAKAIFNGRVHIRHGALKASSEQLNNNLLLSSEAEVDSKPELEIHADDVKATHGSTIGQLNEEEIFYFESRAIPRSVAIEMLSRGFVFELIQKIENKAFAKWMGEKLIERMRRKNV